jgi:pilin isopeptide linkage protein
VVTVTRDENQNLVASVDYPGGNVPIFDNYYVTADSPISIASKKNCIGKDFEDGQFEFELNNTDGTIILYAKNDGSGNINFSEFDLPEGEYDFIMHETTPDGGGWHSDKREIPVHISVTDNGDGTTSAKITYPDGEPIFTNTFNYTPVGAVVHAKKQVCGACLSENMFTFGIFDSSGKKVLTAKNDANGDITFPELSFSAPGVYHYTLKELNPSGNGWECDTGIYGIIVTVTADEHGELSATVTYKSGTTPTFTNYYRRIC